LTPARSSLTTPEEQTRSNTGLAKKLAAARRELLETSTRSRLLHTPLGSRRAKIIEIENELSEEVYRILVREGRPMTFLPLQERTLDNGQVNLLGQPDEESEQPSEFASHYVDLRLQTGLSSEMLQSKLRTIAYDAQTFENEQGVNILYLALGFLRWFEPRNPQDPRFAPLILLPVTLTRASAQEKYRITYSAEEMGSNLSLQERLKEEDVDLPDLPEPDDLSPTEYFGRVTEAVRAIPNWRVQTDSMAVGFYSFAKLMMFRDLEPERWPHATLIDHPLINGLLGDGFPDLSEPLLPDDDDTAVDPLIDLATAGHVVDADSSQMLAIEEVKRGRHLVIQGPPGTGKSQTITNLIAGAMEGGKRVLFVAEKMAALNVVKANLERIGLGRICLELHSHKAKKKTVLDDLRDTYELSPAAGSTDDDVVQKLRARRDALNAHVRALHTPLQPSGFTPFQAFGTLAKLAGTGLATPDWQLEEARNWRRPDLDDRVTRVAQLADHVRKIGVPLEHPWRGTQTSEMLLPADASRLSARAGALAGRIEALAETADQLGNLTGYDAKSFAQTMSITSLVAVLSQAPSMDPAAMDAPEWTSKRAEIEALLQKGREFASARQTLEHQVNRRAWEVDITSITGAFRAHGSSLLRWSRSDYREAVTRFREICEPPTPKKLGERLRVLDTITIGQNAKHYIRKADVLGNNAFGSMWAREDSDWPQLMAIEQWERLASGARLPLEWRESLPLIMGNRQVSDFGFSVAKNLESALKDLQSLLLQLAFDSGLGFGPQEIVDVPFGILAERLTRWAASSERLEEWWIWRNWSGQLRGLGAGEAVDRLGDGRLAPDHAANSLAYVHAEALVRQALAECPGLAEFNGRNHEQVQQTFAELDVKCLKLTRQAIAVRHSASIPRGGRGIGEFGILSHEWHKQRRHLPLRKLVRSAGRAIQVLKPVWMMSPLSLAQFIEPGVIDFDLVVMDEASQVRPVDALGAVARAQQIVVVGDDKQLPPTSFFDRVAMEEEEATEEDDFQAADVESILDLCTAQRLPSRMLRWHYRSQHESLIAVSNLEFYKRLFIVPSATADGLGLHLRKVEGVYDRGGSATNRVEAKVVAEAVIAHAREHVQSARYPAGLSLGVGTFSVQQREAILDELELLQRQHPEVAGFFDPGAPEPFFVKNLESIQGDERDVIFISVGYGRDADGYMAMTFGPISQQGGERRLNVLMSRARRRCDVFSSITAGDIDLERGRSLGVRVLKSFLQYAETGQLDRTEVPTHEVGSDFEEDVGRALATLGYQVVPQVGVAGFYIDLGIKDPSHPGRYILGIECDGATYHSSRSARDRDRLREQVLRDRGWHIHRIWSVDWFRRRSQELQRAVSAIAAAQAAPPMPSPPSPSAAGHEQTSRTVLRPTIVASSNSESPKYREASFTVDIGVEPHLLGFRQQVEILAKIIDIEGPIHEEEIGRRYATVCGKDRAGARIQAATKQGLQYALRSGKLVASGRFYMIAPIKECIPRDRSDVQSGTLRRPDMLPPIEIQTGLRRVVAEQIGVDPSAAITEVARMFGFLRTGGELGQAILGQLREMLASGELTLKNGNKVYIRDT